MLHSDLEILHIIEGRIRVHLPEGLHNPIEAGEFLCCKKGILKFRYNPVIKTAVIWHRGLAQDDLLMQIAVVYARQNNMTYIHLKEKNESRENKLSSSGQGSLLAILVNSIVQLLLPSSPFSKASKWIAIAATAGAIIEHGYHELSERGAFDPEVMSIMYLVNAINKGQTAYAAPLVWLITFGRHLLKRPDKGLMLKVDSTENGKDSEYCVQMVTDIKHNKTAFIGEFLNKYLQTYSQGIPGSGNGRRFSRT